MVDECVNRTPANLSRRLAIKVKKKRKKTKHLNEKNEGERKRGRMKRGTNERVTRYAA